MKRLGLLLTVLLALPAPALAQRNEKGDSSTVYAINLPDVPVTLKEGAGRELVTRYCAICHTLGYIPLQPGFSQQKWAGIVHKMMRVYGAPVPKEDAPKIIEYLGSYYGPGSSGKGGQ